MHPANGLSVRGWHLIKTRHFWQSVSLAIRRLNFVNVCLEVFSEIEEITANNIYIRSPVNLAVFAFMRHFLFSNESVRCSLSLCAATPPLPHSSLPVPHSLCCPLFNLLFSPSCLPRPLLIWFSLVFQGSLPPRGCFLYLPSSLLSFPNILKTVKDRFCHM